ncbi:hypothetical protein Psfp_02280 [Pelotomaculum sp. FP]|nr:hypothetical protein Psfp_02280 [Pelotomaculum sp. FP]
MSSIKQTVKFSVPCRLQHMGTDGTCLRADKDRVGREGR